MNVSNKLKTPSYIGMVASKAMWVRMNHVICVQKIPDITVDYMLKRFVTGTGERYRSIVIYVVHINPI